MLCVSQLLPCHLLFTKLYRTFNLLMFIIACCTRIRNYIIIHITGINLKGIFAIGTDRSGVRVLLCINFGDPIHGYVVPSIRNSIAYLSIYRIELVLQ